MRKGRKNESMKFASELRAEILTEALVFFFITCLRSLGVNLKSH